MTTFKGGGTEWTDRQDPHFIHFWINRLQHNAWHRASTQNTVGNTKKIILLILELLRQTHHQASGCWPLHDLWIYRPESPSLHPLDLKRSSGDSCLFTGMPLLPRRLTHSTPWTKGQTHICRAIKVSNTDQKTFCKRKIVPQTGTVIENARETSRDHVIP